MPLPNLIPAGGPVPVQHTTFAVDAVGRYVCSTWQEATANGGAPFSAVVIGAGMYGAYCAAKIFRRHPTSASSCSTPAGSSCRSTCRTLPGSDSTCHRRSRRRAIQAWHASSSGGSPGVAMSIFPASPTAPAASRSSGAGGVRRLTAADLQRWPPATRQYLEAHYLDLESEIGVVPATDFVFGDLFDVLRSEIVTAAATLPHIETAIGSNGVEVAPLAVQGSAPSSGLFSFDKYSSLPLLVEADPRRGRCLRRERREPPAVSRADRSCHQAARCRRHGAHDRGRRRWPTHSCCRSAPSAP